MDKTEQCARARAVVAALNVATEAVKEAQRQAGADAGKILNEKRTEKILADLAALQAKPLDLCHRMPRK